MFDEKMVADGIKWIFVAPARVRRSQSFVEFQIEHFEAKHLSGAEFFFVAGEADGVAGRRAYGQMNRLKRCLHADQPFDCRYQLRDGHANSNSRTACPARVFMARLRWLVFPPQCVV